MLKSVNFANYYTFYVYTYVKWLYYIIGDNMRKMFIRIGFLLILAGMSISMVDVVSANINDYYSDLEESKNIVSSVNQNYEAFKQKSVSVKDNIVSLSQHFNIFLEEFEEKNEKIVPKINLIEEEIKNISTLTIDLKKYCDYDINNQNIKNKCNSYKNNYKNMIDSYNEMIKVYNSVIDSYNEYLIENEKEPMSNYKSNIGSEISAALREIS